MITLASGKLFKGWDMTVDAVDSGKLDIGRVISQTFGVIGRNFVTFFVLTLLLSGVPTAIVEYAQAGQIGARGGFEFNPAYLTTLAVGGIAGVITACILQGALIIATVQDMNGARPNIGECLATGLRAFLPLLGLSILFSLAVVMGFLLFVVPGLMLLCAWCVAIPALVADRTGVMGAFSRSAELTRGNRWRIFGLLLIVWLIAMVIGAVIGVAMMAAAFGTAGLDAAQLARSPVQIASNTLITTLSTMVSSTGVAVLYVELRRLREGAGPQWLADIFS